MAQLEKSIIRSLINPTIVLDEISFADSEEGTNSNYSPKGTKLSKHIGNNFPLIVINDYVFSEEEIERMVIDSTGFLPEIQVVINIQAPTVFLSKSMPKDGDRMNVFIRARDDIFKPIRNDYLITGVYSEKSQNSQGQGMVLSIVGELFIPKLRDEVIISHNGTSYEVLQQVAMELGLGFASNDTHTSDSQNWICANDTYFNYIKDITGSSWKDSNSFFSCFIDIYYHLNFVNVNSQFTTSTEIDEALADLLISNDTLEGDSIEPTVDKKVFTNIKDKQGTPMYIKRYRVVNQSSEISARYGYKIHCNFFEHNSLSEWDIFSEPLQTQGVAGEEILLKGKAGEDYYKTQVKKRWSGIQYSLPEHNVHENYLFAKVHNLINNRELEKLQLHIEVPRANFNIYRGERVPCVLIKTDDPQDTIYLEQSSDTEYGETFKPVLDKFYSGFYMIHGMIFTYETRNPQNPDIRGHFSEDIILTRRSWQTP